MAGVVQPDYSIIIRCWNEEEHIGRLLTGILRQTLRNVEIIIVDSGSTDATLAIASCYPVKIVSIDKDDFSFGYSLNVGCSAASGDVLVIVSAHVYPVHHDWLEKLVAPLDDERVALVYGRQCGNEATKFSEHQIFAKWFPDHSDCNQGHPFCNNANAAIRRKLWQRFRYDERLTGLEDLAWAKQVLAAGYRIVYEAEAVVVHVHDESRSGVLNRYRREAIAMKEIFPHEHFSLFDCLHMYVKNVGSDLRQALKRGCFWRVCGGVLSFRLMQFWGTYLGFAQRGSVTAQLKDKFYYPHAASRQPADSRAETKARPVIDYADLEPPQDRDPV